MRTAKLATANHYRRTCAFLSQAATSPRARGHIPDELVLAPKHHPGDDSRGKESRYHRRQSLPKVSRTSTSNFSNLKTTSGVTTNSEGGVVDLETFYPVFRAMQSHDMVLNLHGEVATSSIETAEEDFLPTLLKLHNDFPKLRIILEHCTTEAALEAVQECDSDRVAATITAHHLYLTAEDWHPDHRSDPFCFCKPVAKTERDRVALLRAVCSGDSRFFLWVLPLLTSNKGLIYGQWK